MSEWSDGHMSSNLPYARAIASLDKQLKACHNGTNPQLVWMLDELDQRRKMQLSRLQARCE